MTSIPLLSVLIWLPIATGIFVYALGTTETAAHWGKVIALSASVATLLLSVPLYVNFDPNISSMQFVEPVHWIERISAYYY